MISGDPDAAGWADSRGDELGARRDDVEDEEAEAEATDDTGCGTANAA